MTARIVVSCDGDWHGMPCRGFIATRPADDDRYPVSGGRLTASDRGWTQTPDGRDLCPPCSQAAAERLVTRLAAQAPLLSREEAIAALAPVLPGWWPDADTRTAL